MRRGLLPWLCLGALSFAWPAWADATAACRQFDDPDRSIRSCSAIISSGRESRDDLALAHAYRGSAYEQKADYDRAITDETEAIRLNPQLALAFARRGAAFEVKDDHDRAIADENKAIELDPKLEFAYRSRAVAYWNKDDYDLVIADETKAIGLTPNDGIAYEIRGTDYGRKGDYDREIADEDEAIRIDPRHADAYNNRAVAYGSMGDYDRAIADETRAIELSPRDPLLYAERGLAYGKKGDYDRKIGDETRAIDLDPKFAAAYRNRATAYFNKGDYDQAIVDESEAIRLNPKYSSAYRWRGAAYGMKGDYDGAIADETKAIALDPGLAEAYASRGYAHGRMGDHDLDIADQTKAIELKADFGDAYYGRAEAYSAKGDHPKALTDFRAAAHLLPTSDERRATALARVAELESQIATAAAAPAGAATQAAAASPGRRVALVIGNSDYAAVGKLANPQRDADAIAAALKADGFDVTTVDNLTRADFIATINRFSDSAGNADWAVVYFAGHGLQLEGLNYLIPIDAKLAADRDVQDEAIALDRVIGAVSGARTLGLIIVDACRNDPFLSNMRLTVAGRAAHTRGLARIAPRGTTLVEFSARDGQEALDGDPTGNSPFAAALAKRLATPGLEVGKVLRQVREDVLAATANQQEPMFSGDLPAEDVFFRAAQ